MKCAMVPDEKTALYISAPNKMVRRCDAEAAVLEQPQARRFFFTPSLHRLVVAVAQMHNR